jgi:nicotinamidase-related amidase
MHRRGNLHGNTKQTSPVALVLVDVINDLEFEGGDRLLTHALPMAHRVASLKRRCKDVNIPAIYLNDNFGHWCSDLHAQVDHCRNGRVRGQKLVELLAPEPDDYFVLKPKHSGFMATPLDLLLTHLDARALILVGVAGDICVMFTANDAYMLGYHVIVPSDCIASNDAEHNDNALAQMARVLKADTRPSAELDLDALLASPRRAGA